KAASLNVADISCQWRLTDRGASMHQRLPKPCAQSHPARLLRCLLLVLISLSAAFAADPLGATLHKDGTTTFRVWAPFVDTVAVRINNRPAVPLVQEPGHTDPADTTW